MPPDLQEALIGEEKLPDWVKQGVDGYKNDETVLFTNYWVLDKPRRTGRATRRRSTHEAYGFNFGIESVDDIRRLEHNLENDELPDPPIVAGLSVQGFALADPPRRPRASTR